MAYKKNLPGILEKEDTKSVRILSDKGIQQAINLGLIKIKPSDDLKKNRKRIQPATLDVKLKKISVSKPINMDKYSQDVSSKRTTLQAGYISDVELTERISLTYPEFMRVAYEARSSVRRLGGFIPYQGKSFFSCGKNSRLKIGNFSSNNIHFKKEDRVAQLFFTVFPFQDHGAICSPNYEGIRNIAEKIRSLDMGRTISKNNHLKSLQEKGLMNISPKLKTYRGLIKVHASDKGYKIKKINEGLDFNKKGRYSEEELLEPIDISKGYKVKPSEHIIIETLEKFELSPHVGIRFWDNFPNQVSLKDKYFLDNLETYVLTDGWIDPGYNGGFSRQPKWVGKTVYPGDSIGFGQVFYFPKGVNVAYGNDKLGSQYQNNEKTKF
ncbi:MAG: hypothetical protein KKA79_06155 [Nanoarchaeota archaeon]|nr:hypothetical protein [Nanoarchaeota archaeon]MCG2718819.1 hypothetical protein [Nanoarchaeota archaeon]